MKFSDLIEQVVFPNCAIRVQRWDIETSDLQDLYNDRTAGRDSLEAADWYEDEVFELFPEGEFIVIELESS